MAKKLGGIRLAQFEEKTKLPQEAATAWSAVSNLGLVDVSYKCLLYAGDEETEGVKYWFEAERVRLTNPIVRNVVKFAVWQKTDGTLEKQRDVEIF